MVIWFNNRKPLVQLNMKGIVYTLLQKPYRGKDKKTVGEETLMDDVKISRGKVKFTFVKTIKDTDQLREYLPVSGFLSIEEWLKSAKKKRQLFAIELLDRKRKGMFL